MASITAMPAKALPHCQLPVYDFLVPRFAKNVHSRRSFHVSSPSQRVFDTVAKEQKFSASYPASSEPSRVPRSGPAASASPAPLSKPLTSAQREFLESAVRYPPQLLYHITLLILPSCELIKPASSPRPSFTKPKRHHSSAHIHISAR